MEYFLNEVILFLETAKDEDLWESQHFDINDFTELVLNYESWIENNSNVLSDEYHRLYSKAIRLIQQVKEKYNIYCKDSVLEDMFPNDNDGDEDDIIARRELNILRIMEHLHD